MSDNQKMYDRFSNDVLHMIVFAKAASIGAHVDCLYPESFLIGTLLTGENIVTLTLHKHGADLDKCVKRLKRKLSGRQKDQPLTKARRTCQYHRRRSSSKRTQGGHIHRVDTDGTPDCP